MAAVKRKDLVTAAATGDRLDTLIALRDLLAERLQKANSDRDIAAMSRRLMQTTEEIDRLKRQRAFEEDKLDLDTFRKQLRPVRKA